MQRPTVTVVAVLIALCTRVPAQTSHPAASAPAAAPAFDVADVSMPEFADRLFTVLSGDFKTPVMDGTGLAGRYDLQLSWTQNMRAAARATAAATADAAAGVSDPSGAISLFDALSRQLGLKFEQQKRPMEVLVLDHIDETPTEN